MGCCASRSKIAQSKINGISSSNPQSYQQQPQQQPQQNQQQQQQNQQHRQQIIVHQQKPNSQIVQQEQEQQQPQKPRITIAGPPLPADTILGKPFEDIRSHYKLGKELGRGQFGITYLCTENVSGQTYACKSILKRKLVTKGDKEDIKREIQILQHLSGQPNIVEFKGVYEDRQSVHVVMELCAGGELFDRIIAQGHYSERAAASVCRQIVKVVQICNFMGVLHRDLKPENFLLSSKEDGSMLKATDFGLSVFIEEG